MAKSLVVRWYTGHILVLHLKSLVGVPSLIDLVRLLPVWRPSRPTKVVALVVDLKIGHRLCDLVDASIHGLKIFAL